MLVLSKTRKPNNQVIIAALHISVLVLPQCYTRAPTRHALSKRALKQPHSTAYTHASTAQAPTLRQRRHHAEARTACDDAMDRQRDETTPDQRRQRSVRATAREPNVTSTRRAIAKTHKRKAEGGDATGRTMRGKGKGETADGQTSIEAPLRALSGAR